MNDINWIQVGTALAGGGAMGAIITNLVLLYRNRRQPVGSRIDILPVFRPSTNQSQLQAAISVLYAGTTANFENLFLAEIRIQNKGNRDLEELSFGATLGNGDRCIFIETMPPDRHHVAKLLNPVTPLDPQSNIDFSLKPFNRGDTYSFKLYMVIPKARTDPAEIRLGSSSPVRFVEMPTTAEVLARFASEAAETAIAFGPLRIGFRR
jgi:hypothetical protein